MSLVQSFVNFAFFCLENEPARDLISELGVNQALPCADADHGRIISHEANTEGRSREGMV